MLFDRIGLVFVPLGCKITPTGEHDHPGIELFSGLSGGALPVGAAE
jgi:hypothetical protein